MKTDNKNMLLKLASIGVFCTFCMNFSALGVELGDVSPTLASASNAEIISFYDEEDKSEDETADEIELENDIILATDSNAFMDEEGLENDLASPANAEPLSENEIILPEPKRAGYQFVMWNTDIDGNGDSYQSGDILHIKNMKLYAIWEKEEFDLEVKNFEAMLATESNACRRIEAPDGYTDNADGAWIVDGIVQTRNAG